MDINLLIVLIAVSISLIVIAITLLLDSYVRIKNKKLEIDKKKILTRFEYQVAKNYEMMSTLEYIKNTKRIPRKVMENSYEFLDVEKYLDSIDPTIDRLKEKYKDVQHFSKEEKHKKEKIREYIASQNLSKDKEQKQEK